MECCRWSDLGWVILQRCNWEIQTHKDTTNRTWNRGVIRQPISSGAPEGKEESTWLGSPWEVTWKCIEVAGQRMSSELCWQVGRVCTIRSQRWVIQGVVPIYNAVAISDDHEDGIDNPKSYEAASESPLPKTWDMVIIESLDVTGQHPAFGDFMEHPEGRNASPSHWVYNIKCDGAGNVKQFKPRQLCGGNEKFECIECQAKYVLTSRLGHGWWALVIAAKYNLMIDQMDICMVFLGVDLEDKIYKHPPQRYLCLLQTSSWC